MQNLPIYQIFTRHNKNTDIITLLFKQMIILNDLTFSYQIVEINSFIIRSVGLYIMSYPFFQLLSHFIDLIIYLASIMNF